ncbi:hypothetical protein L1285_15205 [Pseudoalteromonas sp. DL2-H2.2]|uniref:hypothetical protein n=1 Tax=Pseudoalteromonas sp. DL2-H2.2 TaxID=2908889 RepID=UPI001F41C650|nr:hypothetical protein [Pseudoalteromonas sp. DL2-H2.2]MCF2909671.1 hypothetical protein [Pseudoalteromonas sp. DL2-H2.2]
MKLTLKTKKMKKLSGNQTMQAQLTPLVQGGADAFQPNGNPPATGSNITTCQDD